MKESFKSQSKSVTTGKPSVEICGDISCIKLMTKYHLKDKSMYFTLYNIRRVFFTGHTVTQVRIKVILIKIKKQGQKCFLKVFSSPNLIQNVAFDNRQTIWVR